MGVRKKLITESLDAEWLELMLVAKNLGLSIEEVKEYLAEKKISRHT